MKLYTPAPVLMVLLLSTGCTQVPNAKDLADKVAQYREEQSDRVERLNSFFDDNYKQLTQALDDISNRQLLEDRNEEAQRIADRLIANPATSLRQTFRDNFYAAELNDRAEIDKADEALQQARDSYKQSYKALIIPLDMLRKAESDLRALEKTDEQQRLTTALQWVYSAYQKVSKQAQKDANPLKKGSNGS